MCCSIESLVKLLTLLDKVSSYAIACDVAQGHNKVVGGHKLAICPMQSLASSSLLSMAHIML